MNLAEIKKLVETDLLEVDKLTVDCLHSQVPLIHEIGHYIIDGGGKRLRPLVVVLTAHACQYQFANHLSMATVIEFIHTATLLHDDVVDEANLRRGAPTANNQWGNEAAVLVGDFLYTRAFQLMMDIGNMPILQVMANATNTIAEGEVLQLAHRKNPDITRDDYFNVIRCKTATLFEAATRTAALLAELPTPLVDTIGQFGHHLGMAYQLVDDILDYSADSEALGKTIGQDLSEGKATMPLIYLLEQGDITTQTLIRQAIESGGIEHLSLIQETITASKALACTRQIAEQHITQAKIAISELPETPFQQALIQLADFITARDH